MKKITLLMLLLGVTLFSNCSKDKPELVLDNIPAPSAIAATMDIKPDNSGKVLITPSGDGITQFQIFYGDGTVEPGIVNPGSAILHTFLEGTFNVKIVGTTLNGKTAESTLPLSLAFFEPSNLVVDIAPIAINSLGITVKATADFESGFEVFYGENPTETPEKFVEGETISHIYTNPGTYQVRVYAVTGGAAKKEYLKTITATIPVIIKMPLDFESATLPYSFVSFGGANTVVADNSKISGINTSAKVASLTKGNASQVWAGSFTDLTSPIDFSVMKKIKMKVWSPKAGMVVRMKIENISDNTVFVEKDATNSVANDWQELTFDFSSVNMTKSYQRVVFFCDFGVAGTGATYYLDDIKQSN